MNKKKKVHDRKVRLFDRLKSTWIKIDAFFASNASQNVRSIGTEKKERKRRNRVERIILTECCSSVMLLTVDKCSDSFCFPVFWIDAKDFVHNRVLNQHPVVLLSAIERLDVCWPSHVLLFPINATYPDESWLRRQKTRNTFYTCFESNYSHVKLT